MSPLAIFFWLGNLACDTAGQLAFKAASVSVGHAGGLGRWRRLLGEPALWIGVACFALEALLWLAFLSFVPLSQGVMMGSLNVVAVMIGGRLLFGEAITRRRATAIMLIAVGVALVAGGGA